MTATANKTPPVSVGPAVAAPSTQALDEVIALTRRLRMPYLRSAALDIVPTARNAGTPPSCSACC
jgi:hypothetical protein